MTTLHAVVRIDHQSAQVLQFDAEHVQADKVKAHTHHTAQHGSIVRTEHEFYGHVADALAGVQEVLVVGAGTAAAAFKSVARSTGPKRRATSSASRSSTTRASCSSWRSHASTSSHTIGWAARRHRVDRARSAHV